MELEAKDLTPRARMKRDQILGAARKLFLDRGFAGTSMEAIREESGVSKPTLYNYYPVKEDLFADVHRNFIDENLGQWLPEMDGIYPESEEALRGVLLSLAEAFVAALLTRPDHLALVRVVVAETIRFPQLGEFFKRVTVERMITLMSTMLEQTNQAGLTEVEDFEAAARMFIGPLMTYVFQEGLLVGEGGPHPPAPERITSVVDLYMRAIRKA